MKKTVILIRNAAPYDFGGGERFPVFLADLLRKNNYEPLIVSRSKKLLDFAATYNLPSVRGWWWTHQNWSGKYVVLFPVYILWQTLLFFYYLQLFLRHHPAVIHIQSKDDFIAGTCAGKLLNKRVVWTDHADLKHIWKNVDVWYKNPVGKLVYLAARRADAITVVSESERILVSDHLKRNSVVAKKLKVVYNGVLEKKIEKIKRDYSFVTFCLASRLVKDKGIGEVIEAFIRLEKEVLNIKLIFLGDGPQAAIFKKQASGHDKIQFLGHKTDPLNYIAESDIFVHPTYHEGFSVALVEASMLGRPIIATAVGGNVEIIQDNLTGLLIPPKDVTALYVAMKQLYNNPTLRETLGENAHKQFAERFEFSHIVKESFIPLYEGGGK